VLTNKPIEIKIHRGSNEIGGSCVELECGNSRILVDFGMPLSDENGDPFDFFKYRNLSVPDLIRSKVLPDVEGFYEPSERKIEGVLISHPHFDHYGLLNYIRNDIPVYISEASYDLVELNNIFTGKSITIGNPVFFSVNSKFRIGEFEITAYLNDHSSFVSYSFLIEAGGKSVFYSGDFRSHGRKGKSFYWFLHNCPKEVDALLMEGTNLGKEEKKFVSENRIEMELVKLFNGSAGINLIYASAQNIDRIVSIYRACKKAGKIFAIDFYAANVLEKLAKYAKIPFPSRKFPEIKVYFPNRLSERIAKKLQKPELLYKFSGFKITKEEISAQSDKIVVLVRPSVKSDLEHIQNLEGGNFIFSQWEGYKSRDEKLKQFIEYLASRNMKESTVHTSGHADVATLKKYVEAISPKMLLPIHTENRNEYLSHFTTVNNVEFTGTVIIQ
jgi:ribonuclease J